MTIQADGLPDDRIACGDCAHFRQGSRKCAALNMLTWPDLRLRCLSFAARKGDPDQRTGKQRWPNLKQAILDARALDAEFAK